MRNQALGVALAFAAVFSISSIAAAQTKPPAKAAPKVTTSEQARDLSGVWMLRSPPAGHGRRALLDL